MIDGYGNWSYYQRAPGDPEATEIDCGTFSRSTDETAVYYADSTMYDGVSYRVFDLDEDILIWNDEYVYYRIDWKKEGDKMKNPLKKYFALLLALVLCLSLTSCSGSNDEPDVVGNDWRVTGVVQGSGTITRGGEDIVVLVCVHTSDATFYYDTEDQVLFDSVDYPITLGDNVWDMFKGIDFADLNGDGNSDVTMHLNDGGTELVMVWFWDTECEQFVYQPEEDVSVPVLTSGELPFTDMETLQSENHEDGTYTYADIAEDGLIIVVNTVMQSHFVYDVQTLEDYLADCALALGDAATKDLLTVEKNEAYSKQMSYPVYIVTYTAGGNEDTREWTVFAMDTDRYTYLYGFGTALDAVDDVKSVYQDVFTSLYLSDEE